MVAELYPTHDNKPNIWFNIRKQFHWIQVKVSEVKSLSITFCYSVINAL